MYVAEWIKKIDDKMCGIKVDWNIQTAESILLFYMFCYSLQINKTS